MEADIKADRCTALAGRSRDNHPRVSVVRFLKEKLVDRSHPDSNVDHAQAGEQQGLGTPRNLRRAHTRRLRNSRATAGVFEEARTSLRGCVRMAAMAVVFALVVVPALAPIAMAQVNGADGTPGAPGADATVNAGVATA